MPALLLGIAAVGDHHLAVVDQLAGGGEADEAVVLVAWRAGVHPGAGAADAVPAFAVAAGVEAEAGEGLIAPVVAGPLLPEGLGHEFTGKTDIETADYAHGHVVHLEVRRQIGVPVGGEDDLFGRPVDEVRAFLAADLAFAVEEVLVVGVLTVTDVALDALVPDDFLLMVVGTGGLCADVVPVDAVGGGVDAGEAGAAGRSPGGCLWGPVYEKVLALGVAAVMVQGEAGLGDVGVDDVGGGMVLEGEAVIAERFLPVEGVP